MIVLLWRLITAIVALLVVSVHLVLISRPATPLPLLVTSQIRPQASLWVRDIYRGREYRLRDTEYGINPAWSPDGRWLVFNQLLPDDEVEVYAYSIVGDGKKSIGSVPLPFRPVWSPDSHWLIFYSGIVSVSGLSYVEFSPNSVSGQKFLVAAWPDVIWSSDAQHLYYRHPNDNNHLFVLPTECLALATCPDVEQSVLVNRRVDELMGWMPGERELMFISTPAQLGRPHLFAVNPQTGQVRQLVDDAVLNIPPSWSPDGQLLAVSLLKAEDYDLMNVTVDLPGLYVIDQDGHETLVWDGIAGQLHWSPAGDYLVFEGVSEDGNNRAIYLYHYPSGQLQNLSPSGALETTPAWGIFPGRAWW
jgi:Tol biopolymer transport system component